MILWRNLKPAAVLAAVSRLANAREAGAAPRPDAPRADSRRAGTPGPAPAKAARPAR